MSAVDAPPIALSPEELRRYGRHLVIPEVGPEGQARLKEARMLLVGAGGLGSPAALYLAAAGVGTLGVVEFDRVDESNLQRQVLYGQGDVGRPKLEAARERLEEINPHVRVVPHPTRLDADNALELVEAYDLVLDGSDNFSTRYLVNDACVLAGKPDVYGAIFRFEGQVSVFWSERGPCYRCLFPEPPPPGTVPSCAEGGVLGVLPGIIGALQASEALKLALGIGEPAVGRYLLFDALRLTLRELKLEKNPECPVCSERPTITELVAYEDVCETEPAPLGADGRDGARPLHGAGSATDQGTKRPGSAPAEIQPADLKARLDAGEEIRILDVRSPLERRICHLEGSLLIPLQELPGRLGEVDPDAEWVVYCHTGVRSAQAVAYLRRHQVPGAVNLAGGIEAWSLTVDPAVPRY